MAELDRRIFKGTNMFGMVYQSIKMDIEGMRDYIEETARALSQKQKQLETTYESAKLEVSEDDPWFDMHFQDEFSRLHKLFPSYTFNSLLVNQYSLIERWLRKLCEIYQSRSQSKIKLSDIWGSDVEKCKKYLNLVADVDFSGFNEQWARIKFIEKLRHNIIHNASHIKPTSENNMLINQLKKESYIDYDVSHGDFFVKDAQFLLDFDITILSFFNKLTVTLSSKKVLARNTQMRYNNDKWGEEKSEEIVSGIITCKILVEKLKSMKGIDETQLNSLSSTLHHLAYNSTKLFAFFTDGEWLASDVSLVMENGVEGLKQLKAMYK